MVSDRFLLIKLKELLLEIKDLRLARDHYYLKHQEDNLKILELLDTKYQELQVIEEQLFGVDVLELLN